MKQSEKDIKQITLKVPQSLYDDVKDYAENTCSGQVATAARNLLFLALCTPKSEKIVKNSVSEVNPANKDVFTNDVDSNMREHTPSIGKKNTEEMAAREHRELQTRIICASMGARIVPVKVLPEVEAIIGKEQTFE